MSQCTGPTLSPAAVPVPPHLCTVEVHEAEGEELQADGEAVEQPEGEGSESVGGHTVSEVEGEEEGAQGGPQQTQEQEGRLVAESLVPVSQNQPELSVDEGEEQRVEDGVGDGQAQLHVGGNGWCDGGRGREVGAIAGTLLLLCRDPLHGLPIHPLSDPQLRKGGKGAPRGSSSLRSPGEEEETCPGSLDGSSASISSRRLIHGEQQEEEGHLPSFCRCLVEGDWWLLVT